MFIPLRRIRDASIVLLAIGALPSCGDDAPPGGGGGAGEGSFGQGSQSEGGTSNAGGGAGPGGQAPTGGNGSGGSLPGGNGQGGSGGSGGAANGGAGVGGSETGGSGTGGTGTGGQGGQPDLGGAGGVGGSSTGGNGGNGGNGGADGGNGGGTGGTGNGGGSGGEGGAGGCSSDAECDNALHCDGPEACITGACVAGTPPCDDGVGCTLDACDENSDTCSHITTNALCDDGVQCNGAESCHALMDCQPGPSPSCDDQIACTADFCDLATDSCTHVTQDSSCDDGLLCNGVESCDLASGCVAGVPLQCSDAFSCTTDACSEAAGGCVFSPSNAGCDDGNFCNGTETCSVASGCLQGVAPTCDDQVDCTNDACSSATKACTHTQNHAFCDDAVYCNGTESCDVFAGCVTTGAVQCAGDGIGCTIEACSESAQDCESVPDSAMCAPGLFCSPAAGCTPTEPCDDDIDCDDGDACNGLESCVGQDPNVPLSGTCELGTPVVCDDSVDCTADTCDPATGTCSFAGNTAYCDNGLACDGEELCDVLLDCLPGVPVDCGASAGCAQNICVEPGMCQQMLDHDQCDNGSYCDGAEVCTPSGCAASAPVQCPDDGIACTDSVCDDMLGCVHVPDDTACPCGQSCEPTSGGCGNFCEVAECQGHVYACGDCIDNDGDCIVDADDDECLGACDNTEDSLYGGISGQNNSPCKSDCYFDQDTGAGNDDCYWSHTCDPFEVAPNYAPESSQCAYNPNANIPGYGGNCASAFTTQSAECADYCGPLTPNGCDCFGCCDIPGAATPVWLGSENNGQGSCTLADVGDPSKCKPCTQVAACLNTCAECEICIGDSTLPPECSVQECNGAQPCGQSGQLDCADGFFCVTGCCQPVAQ